MVLPKIRDQSMPKHALAFSRSFENDQPIFAGLCTKTVRNFSSFVRVVEIWVKFVPAIWKCVQYLTKAIFLLNSLELRNYYYYYYYCCCCIVWFSTVSFKQTVCWVSVCFHCILSTALLYLCLLAILFLLWAICLLTYCVNKQQLEWTIKINPDYICSDVWKLESLN